MMSKSIYQSARLSRDPRFDGLFFVLVKTTKIFCRNTCRVRAPKEINVDYAKTANEALAKGFRPCLRCRPDSAPNSPAWQGVNTTLNRAIELLNNHFDLSITQLAEKLGITPRYLNKLFTDHLNISPKEYKLYQQILMAKNLLQQTSLSVERVAEVVNLPSARQLQIHTKKHMRLTPTEIRNSGVNKNKLSSSKNAISDSLLHTKFANNIEILLNYRPPYDHNAMLSFLATRCIEGNEGIKGNSFSKILMIAQQAIQISLEHKPKQNAFLLSFNSVFSKYTLAITKVVKRMFDLDADPITIHKSLTNAGLQHNEIVDGLRIPGVASEYEAACRAILGQQVSVAAAVNKLNSFHQHFATLRNETIRTHFPLPQEVVNSDLSFLKMPQARKQTLIEVAKFFTNYIGETEKNLISSREDMEKLLDIKGVGPWTLNYVLMRGQSRSDIWLETDLMIKKQVLKLQQSKREFNSDLAKPYRSYLTLNLWETSK